MTEHDLRLHEEAMLLALKDEKGTASSSVYPYALAGGVLTELLMAERVRLEERRRGPPLVALASATQIGDSVLDDAIRQIQNTGRGRTTTTWVQRWARRGTVQDTARRLVQRGILRAEERPVLFVFRRTVYPTNDPGPERRLVEQIRAALFGDDAVDERTTALIALADAAGLLAPLFGRREVKSRKERIAALTEDDAVGEAARAAIQAARAAVVTVVTAATSAAT